VISAMGSLAGAQNQDVTVTGNNAQVAIQIMQKTDLQSVLSALCAQTHYECDVPAEAAQVSIAAISFNGSWDEVIAKVLEGTNLNYASIPGKEGEAGKLLIQVGSSAPLSTVSPMATLATLPAGSGSSAQSTGPNDMTTVQQQNTEAGAASGTSVQSLDAEAASSAEPPSGMAFTPFAGADGKPLAVSIDRQAGAAFAPFPGPDGKAIPVVTNERPAFLPFPDEHGRPIPMPPAAPPGTVTPNPLPPTPR
jgi:hypothetical protein